MRYMKMTKLGKILTYTFLDAIFIVDSDSEVYLRPNARLCALSNTNGISLGTQTNGPYTYLFSSRVRRLWPL